MELAGRVAIVTGGGTGIGRATALRLAKSGAMAVVVNYSRSAAEAEATVKEVMALALAPEVRVNSVSPGLVSSRWFSSRFGDEAAAAQEEAFAKQTPVQKIATPDDVARAVIALLENDLITGQDLVVDGGKNVLYQALI